MRANPIGGRRVQGCALAWLIASLACAGAARAQPLSSEPIGAGFAAPTWATHAPGFPRLLFVAEREGVVRAVDLATGATLEPAFLDIDERVIATDEYGLLGLAFHPDFATNGRLYVHYSDTSGDSRISEFTATLDPLLADPQSERPLLGVFQPQSTQNGGWIGFSPVDGMLYVGLGDGGGANDTGVGHTPGTGNAQDLTDNLLGKMLRLDVEGDDFPADAARNYAIPPDNPFVGVTGDDEIWAYGLRNPFRAGFDRATGDLWIGDVGQDEREEVDFQPADSPGGENYGWRLREGSIATPGSAGGPRPPGAVDPVFEYDHDFGEAITGGTVYRGPVAALRGRYVFGDWFFSRIWSFDPANPGATLDEHTSELGEIPAPVGFGEDAVGNLYVVSLGGDVFRIVPEPGAPAAAAAALLALAALRRRFPGRCPPV